MAQKARNAAWVLRLEAKGPVVPCGPVNKNECKLVTANRNAVGESNIQVDDVEVFGGKLIDGFTTSSLGGCSVCAE